MVEVVLPFLDILGSIGGFLGFGKNPFGDLIFLVKIVMVLMIISFIRSSVQNALAQILLIGAISYVVLVQNFAFFGTAFVIYLMITMGIGYFLYDLLFLGGMGGGVEKMGHAGKHFTGMFRRRH